MTTETKQKGLQRLELACIRFLARREFSQKELGDRLVRGGYPEDQVRQVLRNLSERGLQSDQRYAQQLSDRRIQQGYGPRRLAAELRQRGVDPELVPWPSPEEGQAALESAHKKRFGDLRPERSEDWAARERFLLRRGFSRGDICRFLNRLPRSQDACG